MFLPGRAVPTVGSAFHDHIVGGQAYRAAAAEIQDHLPVVVRCHRHLFSGKWPIFDRKAGQHLGDDRRHASYRAKQRGQGMQRIDAHVQRRPGAGGEVGGGVGRIAGPRRHAQVTVATGGVDRPDGACGQQFLHHTQLGEQAHAGRTDENEIACLRQLVQSIGHGRRAGHGFLRVDMPARGQNGGVGFVVQLHRCEIDDCLGIRLGQHPAIVRVAGRDVIALHRLPHACGRAGADGNQFGDIGHPMEFR